MGLPERERARIRGRRVGMVFQDPGGSLNPVLSVGSQIDEVLGGPSRAQRAGRHAP